MKKAFFMIIVVLIGMGTVFSQSIEVKNPDNKSVWHQGGKPVIIWENTGNTGNNVKIRLYNKTGTIKIDDIANNTPNDGKFPWTIPGSIPDGKYIVRVKSLTNSNYYDNSEIFEIKKNSGTFVDISKAKDKLYPIITEIKILKPKGGKYLDEGKTYSIEWENTLTKNKPLKIDLYNSSGTTFKQNIRVIKPTALKLYPKSTSSIPWTIPDGTFKLFSNGWRIKITRTDAPNISGLSEKFYIRNSGSVKTYKIYAKTLNKYRSHLWKSDSEKFISSVPEKADPGPGKTRTGYENYFFESGSDWYKGYIYRSHVFFDLSNISGFVQSAKLFFNKYSGHNCDIRIYSINKGWTDIFKVDADFLPNLNNLKSYVQSWVNHKNTNFGLLFMGTNENYSHNDKKCVTLCDNIYLELEIYK